MVDKLLSINQAQDLYLGKAKGKTLADNTSQVLSFNDILNDKFNIGQDNVKFSKHASSRLETRNINLSDEQIKRLNGGVETARNKNINESLVMMDDLAFIVNVKNNTVVTTFAQGENGNVFTNIDGAVIC